MEASPVPNRRTQRAAIAAALVGASMLAACARDNPGVTISATIADKMAARWTLSSPGAGSCVMTFAGGPNEGTIAPEGGCPGNFFTSRKWSLERDSLVIRNHLGETLAQLKSGEVGRFDGQSTAGQVVTLSR